jgi:tRNA(Ile)-lysidine synthase
VRKRTDDLPIPTEEAARLFGVLSGFPALVLAVSGGPDSTALLWLAAHWRDALERPPKLLAVTVDHGLRPESAAEAEAVERFAATLKVAHLTLSWTGAKPKTGIQEAARLARYRLLAQAAKEAGARHILTAHTLDDQAETVLFRMARGSGLTGLAGMGYIGGNPGGRGLLARPFLEVRKSRLIATLDAAKVPYVTDPSNADPRFARPRWRALMPALAREGLTAERLGKLAQRAQRAEDALFHVVNQAQADMASGGWLDDGPVTIDLVRYAELPDEIAIRVLARAVAATGNEGWAELAQLEELYAELDRAVLSGVSMGFPARRMRRTLAGALITAENDKLTVEQAPPRRRGAKEPPRRPKRPFTNDGPM